jgi:hypothetical protein
MIDDYHCNGSAAGLAIPASRSKPITAPTNPYKFDIERQKRYVDHIRQGIGRCVAARLVGVSRSTVYNLLRSDPTFREAVHDAEQEVHDSVENALLKAALAGNVTACQVWLYNRRPRRWADRRNASASQGPGTGKVGPVKLVIVEDDSWYGTSTAATEAKANSEEFIAGCQAIEASYAQRRALGDGC